LLTRATEDGHSRRLGPFLKLEDLAKEHSRHIPSGKAGSARLWWCAGLPPDNTGAMNDEERIADIYKKIEREKALISAANLMRGQTNNDAVRSKLDTQMREGRRNLEFFEEKLRELQMKRLGQGVDNLSVNSGSTAATGSAAARRPRSADLRNNSAEGPPTPPPKDPSAWSGDTLASQQYSQQGIMMPGQPPFAAPPPDSSIPKARPNFTKLGKNTR
jgi:hypothetical protein